MGDGERSQDESPSGVHEKGGKQAIIMLICLRAGRVYYASGQSSSPDSPEKQAQPAQIVRVAHNSVGAKWEGQMHSPGWVDAGHGRRRRAWIVGLAIGPVVVYSGTQRVNSKTLVPSSSRTANARMALSRVHSAYLEPAGRTVSWTAGHAARVGLHSDSSGPRKKEVWARCPPIADAGSLRQDTGSNGSHPPRWDAKAVSECGWLLDVGEGV